MDADTVSTAQDKEFEARVNQAVERRETIKKAQKVEEKRRAREARARKRAKEQEEDRRFEVGLGLIIWFIAALIGIVVICLDSMEIITQDYTLGMGALVSVMSILATMFVCGCRF